ncbi:MAG: hypothetical protein R3F61_25630 [Myxococcota bacterium]
MRHVCLGLLVAVGACSESDLEPAPLCAMDPVDRIDPDDTTRITTAIEAVEAGFPTTVEVSQLDGAAFTDAFTLELDPVGTVLVHDLSGGTAAQPCPTGRVVSSEVDVSVSTSGGLVLTGTGKLSVSSDTGQTWLWWTASGAVPGTAPWGSAGSGDCGPNTVPDRITLGTGGGPGYPYGDATAGYASWETASDLGSCSHGLGSWTLQPY